MSGHEIDKWEALRPYVINLTEGKLSTTGRYQMHEDSLNKIFNKNLPEYFERCHNEKKTARIMVFAHGGLVSEKAALKIAEHQCGWWIKNDIYPLYFVWETGLYETICSLFGERQPAGKPFSFKDSLERLEEIGIAIRDAAQDVTDSANQFLARRLGGPAIWAKMKSWPPVAIQHGFGADQVAQRLVELVRKYPQIELHAAGHSAGSIFHASFLPHYLNLSGADNVIKSLHLLAPAITIADFENTLAPKLGAGIDFTRIYTMNDRDEKDDNCLHLYQKSLLYLIYYALEPDTETHLLGLEHSLANPGLSDILRRAFRLNGARSQVGQVLFTPRKKETKRPLNNQTASKSHGGFDDDPATMNSIAHYLLGVPPKVPFGSMGREELDAVYASYTEQSATEAVSDDLEMGTPQGRSFGAATTTHTPKDNARVIRRAIQNLVDSVLEG